MEKQLVDKLQMENFDLKLRLREQQQALAAMQAPADVLALQAAVKERDSLIAKARDLITQLKDELQSAKQNQQQLEDASRSDAQSADLAEQLRLAQKEIARLKQANTALTSSASSFSISSSPRPSSQQPDFQFAAQELFQARDEIARLKRAVDSQLPQWERIGVTLTNSTDPEALLLRFSELETDCSTWRSKYEQLSRNSALQSSTTLSSKNTPSTSQVQAVEHALRIASDRLETLERDHHVMCQSMKSKCQQLEQRNRELVRHVRDLDSGRKSGLTASGTASSASKAIAAAATPSPTRKMPTGETPYRLEQMHQNAVHHLDLLDSELLSTSHLLNVRR